MRRVTILLVMAGCGRFGFDENAGPTPPDPDAPVDDGLVRITIIHGGGDGTIMGPDALTCTADPCVLDVVPGTAVSLRGIAATDAWFAGWSGPCGGNFKCEFVATADVTVTADFQPTPNRIFVTSGQTNGAIGGLGSADTMCASHAAAAGLNGTFVAYLSEGGTEAPSRLAGSRGWVRTDGAPFADTANAFSTGVSTFPVRLDENANDLGDTRSFTGTSFGSAAANRCLDWTSNLGTENGAVNYTGFGFDGFTAEQLDCSEAASLLCTEIGRNVPVAAKPDTGRLAFTSSTGWTPGGGRASADAHCAALAAAAGMSGTFLAAIATTTESVKDRFDDQAIYRRVDGVRLLRGPGLFTTDFIDVPAQLDQSGAIVSNDFWTGADRLDQLADAGSNCNDWTDGTSTGSAALSFSTATDYRNNFKTLSCDSTFPLLCLEN